MRWVIRGDGTPREIEVQHRGDVFEITIDGAVQQVELVPLDGAFASLRYPDSGRSFQITYHHDGHHRWRVGVGTRMFDFAVLSPSEAVEELIGERESGPSRLTAPIPGKVVAVKVAPGDEVVPGQPLIVLEAMKMENELAADQAGRVAAVAVSAGDTVESGELLVEIE
jgi:3-methylcrotonyl-CoA carboxylase alpha subunit